MIMRTGLVLVLALLALCGCASAHRDITFLSRVPSIEPPIFNPHRKFGLNLHAEQRRFGGAITNNLVTSFQFVKDKVNLDERTGLDLGLTWAADMKAYGRENKYTAITTQLEASFDYFSGKFGYDGQRSSNPDNFVMSFGIGSYSAVASSSRSGGSCGSLICFGSASNTQSVIATENSIETSQSGSDAKLSFSVGYRTSEKGISYVGASQMTTFWKAAASKPGFDPISFEERFRSIGYGIGYVRQVSPKAHFSISVQQLILDWNQTKYQRGMFNIGFLATN